MAEPLEAPHKPHQEIKHMAIDSGETWSFLIVARKDGRIFMKNVHKETSWEEIETASLYED
jgi:hypothetical protein